MNVAQRWKIIQRRTETAKLENKTKKQNSNLCKNHLFRLKWGNKLHQFVCYVFLNVTQSNFYNILWKIYFFFRRKLPYYHY
jgi:hypothetical protein